MPRRINAAGGAQVDTGSHLTPTPHRLIDDHRSGLSTSRLHRRGIRPDHRFAAVSRACTAGIQGAPRRGPPLARALAPGGRLIAIHTHGNDPGLEFVRRIWPDENPFTTDRHALLRATKVELGTAGRDLNFGAYADARSLFRYDMHTLPSEISETIGTSTLFAAWYAAVYVAQIEDQRLSEAISSGACLDATQAVLHEHGGLWFWDESFVISRKRDSA